MSAPEHEADCGDGALKEALLDLPKLHLVAVLTALPRPALAQALDQTGVSLSCLAAKPQGVEVEEASTATRSARRQSLNSATAVFDNWTRSAECFILNRSGTGFLIEAGAADQLPDCFDLSITSEDATYPVRVVWRKDQQLGLAVAEA